MNDPAPPDYALRVTERAARDIEAHLLRLEDIAGPDTVLTWREGILAAIASLAHAPRHCQRIPEQSRFGFETRQLLYRRTPGGPARRLRFTLTGDEQGAPDLPAAHLLHVRHAAEHPITPAEACTLENQQ